MMDENIIGLIPAAGKGLRLGLPYPKELYPIIRDNHYKPVSQFVLENLVTAEVKHIVFVINETKSQLIGFFGNGNRFGCCTSYVVQEDLENRKASTSPGLAHALDSAYHLIRGKTVFFGMADTIMQPADVFCQGYQLADQNDDVVLCLFPTQNPEKFGMVSLQGDRVQAIVDKPKKTDLTLMWGCMIWKPTFSDFLHESVNTGKIADFAQIMNDAIRAGLRFRGVTVAGGNYIDLGTYEEIMELDQHLRAG